MILRTALFLILISIFSIYKSLAQIAVREIDSVLAVAKQLANVDSSNVLIEQVIQKSKKIGYTNGIISGVLTKGVNLYNHNKFEDALKLTHAWEKVIVSNNNYVKISHLYALRGNCYGRLSFFEESNKCLMKSLFYGKKIIDDEDRYYNLGRTYGIIAQNILKNTSVPVNLDSVLYYQKKAYNLQKKIKKSGSNKSILIIQSNAIARSYVENKNADSARHYLNNGLTLIKLYGLEKYKVETLFGLGTLNFQEKKLDSSLFYYHEALKVSMKTKSLLDTKESYQKLSEIYAAKGDMYKSLEYVKKYGTLTDSLATVNVSAVKSAADIIIKEKEGVFENKQWFYTLLIICSVLLLIALSYILVLFLKKHKKTVATHKTEQQLLFEKLELLSSKTLNDKVDEHSLKEIIQLAASNDPAFLIKFKEYHPIFIEKLMKLAPTLVSSDLLICAQLRLGFYTKEIARYTDITVRAVEGKKYRIRKKLDIPASEDINVWMMKI